MFWNAQVDKIGTDRLNLVPSTRVLKGDFRMMERR